MAGCDAMGSKLKMAIMAVAMIFLAGAAFGDLFGWLLTSATVLAVVAMFVGATYILSGLLGARVLAHAKNLFYHLLGSAIILTIIFLAIHVMYSQGIDQIKEAQMNVVIIRDTIIAEDIIMVSATAALSLIGNLTPYFRPAGIIGISFSLQPAFRPIFDWLGIVISLLSVSVGEWFVHEFLLCFIKTRMLNFMLPAGLFLRGFGLDRAGNVVIAIAIGFFFVYPFMINVTTYAIEAYFDTNGNPADNFESHAGGQVKMVDRATCRWLVDNYVPAPCYLPLIGETAARELYNRFARDTSENTTAAITLLAAVQFFTGSLPASLLIEFAIFGVVALFKASVFYVVIVSVILPMFNLFVTFTLIKEIAAALGTDIDLSALEKLI